MSCTKATRADVLCGRKVYFRSRVRRRVVAFEDHAFQQRHPQGIGSKVAAFTEVFLKSSEKRRVDGVARNRVPPSQVGHVPAGEGARRIHIGQQVGRFVKAPVDHEQTEPKQRLATTAVRRTSRGKVAGSIA